MTSADDYWTQKVHELLAYCAKYDPRFMEAIAPASLDDIAHLEALTKHTFPPEYRVWLCQMGRTSYNGLGAFLEDTEYGVKAFESFYRDPPMPIPADAIYVATLDQDAKFFLPVEGPPLAPRALLLVNYGVDEETHKWVESDRHDFAISSSLLTWLHFEAFRMIRFPLLKYRAELEEPITRREPAASPRSVSLARVLEVATKLGFSELPHQASSDPICLDREDSALLFHLPSAGGSLTIKANDERELARLVEIFTDNFDFRVRG
jgi:hypothetical protein